MNNLSILLMGTVHFCELLFKNLNFAYLLGSESRVDVVGLDLGVQGRRVETEETRCS
jgi:hypothetical protein